MEAKDIPVSERIAIAEEQFYFEKGKQAGIKEVVDWIKYQATDAPNGMMYVFLGKDWLIKLKEWGISI